MGDLLLHCFHLVNVSFCSSKSLSNADCWGLKVLSKNYCFHLVNVSFCMFFQIPFQRRSLGAQNSKQELWHVTIETNGHSRRRVVLGRDKVSVLLFGMYSWVWWQDRSFEQYFIPPNHRYWLPNTNRFSMKRAIATYWLLGTKSNYLICRWALC
jgi:hypothetical protein